MMEVKQATNALELKPQLQVIETDDAEDMGPLLYSDSENEESNDQTENLNSVAVANNDRGPDLVQNLSDKLVEDIIELNKNVLSPTKATAKINGNAHAELDKVSNENEEVPENGDTNSKCEIKISAISSAEGDIFVEKDEEKSRISIANSIVVSEGSREADIDIENHPIIESILSLEHLTEAPSPSTGIEDAGKEVSSVCNGIVEDEFVEMTENIIAPASVAKSENEEQDLLKENLEDALSETNSVDHILVGLPEGVDVDDIDSLGGIIITEKDEESEADNQEILDSDSTKFEDVIEKTLNTKEATETISMVEITEKCVLSKVNVESVEPVKSVIGELEEKSGAMEENVENSVLNYTDASFDATFILGPAAVKDSLADPKLLATEVIEESEKLSCEDAFILTGVEIDHPVLETAICVLEEKSDNAIDEPETIGLDDKAIGNVPKVVEEGASKAKTTEGKDSVPEKLEQDTTESIEETVSAKVTMLEEAVLLEEIPEISTKTENSVEIGAKVIPETTEATIDEDDLLKEIESPEKNDEQSSTELEKNLAIDEDELLKDSSEGTPIEKSVEPDLLEAKEDELLDETANKSSDAIEKCRQAMLAADEEDLLEEMDVDNDRFGDDDDLLEEMAENSNESVIKRKYDEEEEVYESESAEDEEAEAIVTEEVNPDDEPPMKRKCSTDIRETDDIVPAQEEVPAEKEESEKSTPILEEEDSAMALEGDGESVIDEFTADEAVIADILEEAGEPETPIEKIETIQEAITEKPAEQITIEEKALPESKESSVAEVKEAEKITKLPETTDEKVVAKPTVEPTIVNADIKKPVSKIATNVKPVVDDKDVVTIIDDDDDVGSVKSNCGEETETLNDQTGVVEIFKAGVKIGEKKKEEPSDSEDEKLLIEFKDGGEPKTSLKRPVSQKIKVVENVKKFKKSEKEEESLVDKAMNKVKENSNITLSPVPKVVEAKPIYLDFLPKFKKPLEKMSRGDLEEFVLQKIVEAIAIKSDMSDLRNQIDSQDQLLQGYRQKVQDLNKQFKDLEMVHERVLKDLEKKNHGFVTPVKITRAVGLQVSQPRYVANSRVLKTPTIPVPDAAPAPAPVPTRPTPALVLTSNPRTPTKAQPLSRANQQPIRIVAGPSVPIQTPKTTTVQVRAPIHHIQPPTTKLPPPMTQTQTRSMPPVVPKMQSPAASPSHSPAVASSASQSPSNTPPPAKKKTLQKFTPMRPPLSLTAQVQQQQQTWLQQEQLLKQQIAQSQIKPASTQGPPISPTIHNFSTPINIAKPGPENKSAPATQNRVPPIIVKKVAAQVKGGANTLQIVQRSAAATTNPPAATPTTEKAPSSTTDKSFIDLTDEEDVQKQKLVLNGVATSPSSPLPPLVVINQTNSRASQQSQMQPLMQKFMVGTPNRPIAPQPRGGTMHQTQNGMTRMSMMNGRMMTHRMPNGQIDNARRMPYNPALRRSMSSQFSHPAQLPLPGHQPASPNWKNPPPRPSIRINNIETGIVISWTMDDLSDQNAQIISYQIYAYQETTAPPSSEMWRHVGDVKAMLLPMAVTLTQFQEGQRYHFAVRAVDEHSRVGQFSPPRTWNESGTKAAAP